MDAPICANFVAHTCERSDTFVEGERAGCYVIRCRTCKGINVWPASPEERRTRYEADLKRKAQQAEQIRAAERQRLYSVPALNPGVKGG